MSSDNLNDEIRNEVAHARAKEHWLERRSKEPGSEGDEARAKLAAINENRMLDALANKILSRIQIHGNAGIKTQGANGVFTVSLADQTSPLPQNDVASGSSPIEFALYAVDGGIGISMGVVTPWNPTSGVTPWPQEFNSTNGYKAEFSTSGNGMAWLRATTNSSGAVLRYNVGVRGGDTAPENSATQGYLILGTYDSDGNITSGMNGIGNQFYNWCSGNHMWGPA